MPVHYNRFFFLWRDHYVQVDYERPLRGITTRVKYTVELISSRSKFNVDGVLVCFLILIRRQQSKRRLIGAVIIFFNLRQYRWPWSKRSLTLMSNQHRFDIASYWERCTNFDTDNVPVKGWDRSIEKICAILTERNGFAIIQLYRGPVTAPHHIPACRHYISSDEKQADKRHFIKRQAKRQTCSVGNGVTKYANARQSRKLSRNCELGKTSTNRGQSSLELSTQFYQALRKSTLKGTTSQPLHNQYITKQCDNSM